MAPVIAPLAKPSPVYREEPVTAPFSELLSRMSGHACSLAMAIRPSDGYGQFAEDAHRRLLHAGGSFGHDHRLAAIPQTIQTARHTSLLAA